MNSFNTFTILSLSTLLLLLPRAESKFHIHVVNQLSSEKVLFVHCKSKDDDLGPHKLTTNQEFTWSFNPNIWGNTLFWCYLAPWEDNVHAYIDAFKRDYTGFLVYCDLDYNCVWVAKDDGIYLKNLPMNTEEKKKLWELGRSNT